MKRKILTQSRITMCDLRYLVLAFLPIVLAAEPTVPANSPNTPPTKVSGAAYAAASNTPAPNIPALSAPAPSAPMPPAPEYTEEQLLTEAGWVVGKRSQLSELGFNDDQIATILRGMTLSLQRKDAPLPLETVNPRIAVYMQNRMQVARANAQKAAEAKETAFFAELKSKGTLSTPSGLYYEIIQPGTDKKPAATDSVTVNYTGRLLGGKVFDSSAGRGTPAVFQLSRMIRGWAEGLQLIGEGGKIKLYVPFALAYGPRNQPNVPAFSTLEFDVELVSVTPAPVISAPAFPAPINRAQVNPGAIIPAPSSPAPTAPAPIKPAPSNSTPVSPAPVSGTNK